MNPHLDRRDICLTGSFRTESLYDLIPLEHGLASTGLTVDERLVADGILRKLRLFADCEL